MTHVLFFRNVEILPMKVPLGRRKHIYIQRIFSDSLIKSRWVLSITTIIYPWLPRYSHIKCHCLHFGYKIFRNLLIDLFTLHAHPQFYVNITLRQYFIIKRLHTFHLKCGFFFPKSTCSWQSIKKWTSKKLFQELNVFI